MLDELHLISLQLSPHYLVKFGRGQGLVRRDDIDPGYLVHAWLQASFGEHAPKPFVLEDTRGGGPRPHRGVTLLGYSSIPASSLQEVAELCTPEVWQCANWESLVSRPMPRLTVDRQVGFRVRVCPTTRSSYRPPPHDSRIEVDYYQAEVWKRADEGETSHPDRSELYCQWLTQELARRGGADLVSAELSQFQLRALLRRQQGEVRLPKLPLLPDVVLSGTLRITDVDLFRQTLRRGLGRHRAFGFGMLCLSPARGG